MVNHVAYRQSVQPISFLFPLTFSKSQRALLSGSNQFKSIYMAPGQGNKLLIKIYANFTKPVDFFLSSMHKVLGSAVHLKKSTVFQ